ncbi:hypothetical protein TKK_0005051 [Trichogramma kaykai]|uniref:Uncharacterized protein n=1 Tax=Trichogramma kaykai TaxID=54128 RepID=A0ABD2XI84_9HYME
MILLKNNSKSSIPEWMAIDVHGSIKCSHHLSKILFGELYKKKDGDIVCAIGTHILEGHEIDLEKPIIILKKNLKSQYQSKNKTEADASHDIAAVIRKKLVFRSRPIMSNISSC